MGPNGWMMAEMDGEFVDCYSWLLRVTGANEVNNLIFGLGRGEQSRL